VTDILLAEDEPRIAAFVMKGLRSAGFVVTLAGDGATALGLAQTGLFQLVVLDVGLPTLDGFEVLERLRQTHPSLPVVILTARHGLDDTVHGLDAGASDYITKPFKLEELVARVRLRLRERGVATGSELRHRTLRLDLTVRKAQVDGRMVDLSGKEFALAEQFFTHPGELLTKRHLLRTVWNLDFDPGSNIVEVYVKYLRGKLGPSAIETVRGAGYRLV
jgi:DNA-binding response OmpR family regulator